VERIAIPLLVMHGSQDQVADIEGSRELCARARSRDKRIRICDGLYHEIMNEPEKASVLEEMSGWLDVRTSQLVAEHQLPNSCLQPTAGCLLTGRPESPSPAAAETRMFDN